MVAQNTLILLIGGAFLFRKQLGALFGGKKDTDPSETLQLTALQRAAGRVPEGRFPIELADTGLITGPLTTAQQQAAAAAAGVAEGQLLAAGVTDPLGAIATGGGLTGGAGGFVRFISGGAVRTVETVGVETGGQPVGSIIPASFLTPAEQQAQIEQILGANFESLEAAIAALG